MTSVDMEGRRKGFDVDLVRSVSEAVTIPVIASGGMGKIDDFGAVVREGKADAVAFAYVLHYDVLSLADIRDWAQENHIAVRSLG